MLFILLNPKLNLRVGASLDEVVQTVETPTNIGNENSNVLASLDEVAQTVGYLGRD